MRARIMARICVADSEHHQRLVALVHNQTHCKCCERKWNRTMGSLPYKLQLTKGFFADFGQIARVLAYAVEHRDKGRILPAPTG